MTTERLEFEDVVDRFQTDLYRFAYSLAKNPADASDLTQQTFFIWAEKGHQLRKKSKAKSWLFQTLYREFLKLGKHRQRQTPVGLEPELLSNESTPSGVERDVDFRTALEALQEISENYRAPLTLFYLDGMAYKEIAEILDINIGTVMSRLSRGRDHLRKALIEKTQNHQDKITPFPSATAKKKGAL